MNRREEPIPIREALAGVGRELGLPDPDQFSRLLDAWPDLVGSGLVGHAQLRSLRDGVLVVAVDSPAAATQIRYLEGTVRETAERLCGGGVVRRLQVAVNSPGKPF
jgi:hypothetical protein